VANRGREEKRREKGRGKKHGGTRGTELIRLGIRSSGGELLQKKKKKVCTRGRVLTS